MHLVYVATPYTKYEKGHEAAFREACRCTAALIDIGYKVFSPISHTHPLAEFVTRLEKSTTDFWLGLDEPVMERCDVLVVVEMAGWRDSAGVARELAHFRARKAPINYMRPWATRLYARPWDEAEYISFEVAAGVATEAQQYYGRAVEVTEDEGVFRLGFATDPCLAALLSQSMEFKELTPSQTRKTYPLARGLVDYFPRALAAVANVSHFGNEKHNPGEPLHWSREKSSDHDDCIMRHFISRGSYDPEDGLRHSAKMAWRALALLELELEADDEDPLND